jgi:serine phosphatase RsbU (regulator of sigma subunit)/ligand-binding sensor domain-containing protein
MNNSLNNFLKCTILLLIVSTRISFSQLNPNNITQFTEKDGVPGSQVGNVLIDKFGYVWIGTINGLARYDGYEFNRFYNDPNDPTSIKGLIIWSLFEDSKGRLWIGSSPEILNLYDQVTKSFKQYEYKHLIERQANVEIGITNICEDDQGRIYFGVRALYDETLSSSLLYFDEKENNVKKLILPDSLIVQNVYKLVNDKNGNIYISSATGFFKIDPDRKISRVTAFIKELENSNEHVTYFDCDNDAHIWFITNKSRLFDYDPHTGKYKIYDSSEFYKSSYDELRGTTIIFDKDDNLWIGTRNGIFFFNREKKIFESFSDPTINPTKNEIILDLTVDSFGTLWIGTQFGGLFKYEERTLFNSYRYKSSDKNSLTPGWANNIYEARDGKIWITSSGQGNSSGLNIFDIKTRLIKPIPFQNFLPDNLVVFGLIQISSGEFLISTEKGVYTYYPESNKVNRIELKGVPDSIFIHDFLKDKYENFWLCSSDGLYKRSNGDDVFKRYDLSLLGGSNEITGALESKKHGIWLITTNGLFLYNYKTNSIEPHGFDKARGDVFGTQDINSLYEDSGGTVWVGTWQGGLSKYNVETKKIKTYTRNDGLPSMGVQGILEDENKDALWLSTFDGLSFFNTKTEKFNNFSIADGIQSQLFAEGSSLKTSDGHFIFGGANGITIFSSNDVNNNSIPPKVFLTDLKLFNKSIIPGDNSILKKPIYETKEIILAHDQNNISIEFTALHFSNPGKNITLFKLENFENVWRDAGSQHSAFYPNLSPGEYLFRVKAANNNGVWNEEGASLKIIIKSPWWQTWWAYALYLLGFVSLLGGLRKFELDRRKEKEDKKLLQLENDRKSKELEEARQLQLSMLPKELPKLPNLDIAVYMKTATEVGGDYYDFIVALDGTLTVAVGDATGHGMKAGTIVSMVKALFATGGSRLDMKTFFDQSSDALKKIELGRLMMAFMMIKIKSNKIEIANAGMPPLFIYRKQSKAVEEILINGMPLGAMKNFPYEIKEIDISSGDTILLISDGFPELQNINKEMFGYNRARNSFEEVAKKEPELIINYLKEVGSRWTNDKDPDDDVTFVVIKVK